MNSTVKGNVLLFGKRNQLLRRRLKQSLCRFLLHLSVLSAVIPTVQLMLR